MIHSHGPARLLFPVSVFQYFKIMLLSIVTTITLLLDKRFSLNDLHSKCHIMPRCPWDHQVEVLDVNKFPRTHS